VRLHFPHDLATVNTDCDFTGTQLGGSLLAEQVALFSYEKRA